MPTPRGVTPDWTVFHPVKVRIAKLMSDGKPRSVLHVCQALQLGSNCNARKVLENLTAKGQLTRTYEKVERHPVAVYVAARAGRKRVGNRTAVG